MSFKLQDAIQKIKGIPGKYKRVLLAASSHARKDGSNIWASKETIGAGAGVSRWTAYRNIDPLIEKRILVESDTHTCSNPNCPKGSRHSTGRGNHWTQVYHIDIVALRNATWESKKSRSKMLRSGVAKCTNSSVAKCDANKGIVGTGEKESSVLTHGVSELVSELAQPTPEKTPDVPLSVEADTILKHIYPVRRPFISPEDADKLNDVAKENSVGEWDDFFEWHKTHKPDNLRYRSLEKFFAGVDYSLNNREDHDANTCKVCNPPKPKDEPKDLSRLGYCIGCGESAHGGTMREDGLCAQCFRDGVTPDPGSIEDILAQNRARAAAANREEEA